MLIYAAPPVAGGETNSALAATQWPLPTRETTTVTQWGPAPPRAISGQFLIVNGKTLTFLGIRHVV